MDGAGEQEVWPHDLSAVDDVFSTQMANAYCNDKRRTDVRPTDGIVIRLNIWNALQISTLLIHLLDITILPMKAIVRICIHLIIHPHLNSCQFIRVLTIIHHTSLPIHWVNLPLSIELHHCDHCVCPSSHSLII